jgi:hypothetical protein
MTPDGIFIPYGAFATLIFFAFAGIAICGLCVGYCCSRVGNLVLVFIRAFLSNKQGGT